ncbi:MAG: hypothetical protein JWP44_3683 [Mucilaginibacter sp.]|nr:hypothetical protein [Mucilaginibacter sp.]
MNIRYSVFLFIAALAGLASCKNNDEVIAKTVISNINVVNASADTLNFFVNGTRNNNNSGLYPGSQSYYLKVPTGSQNYSFKKAGPSTPNQLFSLNLNLKDSTYNTIYVTGEASSGAFSTVDNLYTDTAFAQVRFVNASPDAGSLNVTVGKTVNFAASAFKSSSAFLKVTGGQNEVKIYLAGASTPKIDTIITMTKGRGYTLFSKGLLTGKGTAAFNVGMALNF